MLFFGNKFLIALEEHLGKEFYQLITSKEFAKYPGISLETVTDYLQKVL